MKFSAFAGRISAAALLAAGVIGFNAGSAVAAQLPLAEIVNATTTSTGNLVTDGLEDAFDGWGGFTGQGALSVSRQINTLEANNTYRILDIFTNNTAAPIATTIAYLGNLGSDGNEFVVLEGEFSAVSFEDASAPFGEPDPHVAGCCTGDPVLAFTFGNNAFTSANAVGDIIPGYFDLTFAISVAPGESLGLLQFATLVLDDTNRRTDVVRALKISLRLRRAPNYSGLSPDQIATIVNFDSLTAATPLPATLPLFGTGLGALGLLGWRRKKKAAALAA